MGGEDDSTWGILLYSPSGPFITADIYVSIMVRQLEGDNSAKH